MLWIILVFLVALLWAVIEIIDKYIISQEMRDPILATVISGIGTFLLFAVVSLLFSNILLPVTIIIFAVAAGIFYNTGIWLYYSGLSREEVSRFGSLLSIIPLFVLLFAFLFLNERFTALRYIGIILIVFGSILISMRKITYKAKFNFVFLIAILAALFFALKNIFIKFVTLKESIWPIFFWVGVGVGLVSLILFFFHHPHIRKKAKKGIGHLLLVGSLTAIAFFIYAIAISMGPVSLVTALAQIKPLFVFLLAIILSIFYPKILKEKITKSIIIQKLVAIAMIITGAILII